MANKKISKPVSDATASKVSEPISKEKKTNSVSESTPVKKTSKKEEVVVEEEVVDETSEKKKRVVPTRESVVSSFDEVIQMVETEIAGF